MAAIIDFIQGIASYFILIVEAISFIVTQSVRSIVYLVDLIPRLYISLAWLPLTCMGILSIALTVILVDKVIKFIGAFL